ncbi:hypothetical protein ACFW0F_06800 [Brucella anthropi]|uniref:hypothetical protein n=1 Tax=Brucella anthropi TaxID=529 RepID=UPI0036707F1A
MAIKRRKAKYIDTLIYLDEPQLIALTSDKVPVLAIAVPDEAVGTARFLATTMTQQNWESYLDGNTDLRFLFTYPRTRKLYYFDLHELDSNQDIMMTPAAIPVPEYHLPLARLFSSEHTKEFKLAKRASDEEKLIIDGEWEMPQFGEFYQKYSDMYAFLASLKNWADPAKPQDLKNKIANTFRSKPFEGGSSYVHFYKDLVRGLVREQRPSLESIQYNSPGVVNIHGEGFVFSDISSMVTGYLNNRKEVIDAYGKLHSFLSKNKYLKMPGAQFLVNSPGSGFIDASARKLSDEIGSIDYDAIFQLSNGNALVSAKIVLSLCRRVEDAAEYFAQGRMSYSD